VSELENDLKATQSVPIWDELLLRSGLENLAEKQRGMSPAEFQAFLTLCQRQQHQRMERVIVKQQSSNGAS
jgi:hypothetical protein